MSIILFITIFFSVIFVIALFIVTFLLGRNTVKNNPKNATVLVKKGSEVLPFKGKMAGNPLQKGTRYIYNTNKIVLVPAKNEEIFVKNRRLIFLNRLGQLIASPFDKDVSLSPDERDELIYEAMESKMTGDAIREIKGKPTINFIVIGIIAFILGIGAVFAYNYVNDMISKNNIAVPQNTQQTTENITSNMPRVGVK